MWFFLFIALYIFIGIIHCSDWFLKLFIFLYKKNSKLPKSALINKIVFIQIRLLFLIIKKSRQAFRCFQPRREVAFGKQKQNNFFLSSFFFFFTLWPQQCHVSILRAECSTRLWSLTWRFESFLLKDYTASTCCALFANFVCGQLSIRIEWNRIE